MVRYPQKYLLDFLLVMQVSSPIEVVLRTRKAISLQERHWRRLNPLKRILRYASLAGADVLLLRACEIINKDTFSRNGCEQAAESDSDECIQLE